MIKKRINQCDLTRFLIILFFASFIDSSLAMKERKSLSRTFNENNNKKK
ncbi:hypothetical protein [Halalkalibacterium ligniniphilum]|nr:hypothetical protein [Halalkalibacterium ligniniphilum]